MTDSKAPRKPRAKKDETKVPEAEVLAPGSVEAKTEIIVAEAQTNPVSLFTDEARYSEFYERIKSTVSGHVPDVSTAKGRDAIRSLAFRVTKAKTTLDKAGLGLTEDWRGKIAVVNAARSKMTGELQTLATEVRRPLTEWEEAEDARIAKVEAALERFKAEGIVGEEETASDVEERGRALHEETLDPAIFGDRLEEALEAKAATVTALARAFHTMKQAEADRAELARLRAAEEERQHKAAQEEEARGLGPALVASLAQADPDAETVPGEYVVNALAIRGLPAELETVTAEAVKPLWEEHRRQRASARAEVERAAAAERARIAEEAAAEERRRLAEEAAREAERREEEAAEREAARLAEEQAREAARRAEDESRRAAHEAELAEVRAREETARREAREAEDRAREEREERERADAARAEEEAAAARAQAKREADQAHRRTVAAEAAEDLAENVSLGDEEEARRLSRAIVLAIAAGTIRHVSIKF